ncbi:MAG: alpha/beta hydrolase [Bacteroidota bacterium]
MVLKTLKLNTTVISTLILVFVSCTNSVNKEHKQPNYWSNNVIIKNNVAYNNSANSMQKLDLYLQGTYVGEPIYTKIDSTPRSTLIYIHGGGWAVGDKQTSMNYFLHFLEKGWNVISVNYTLAKPGDNFKIIPTTVNDVMTAINWVVNNADKYNIDKSNIVLGGESAGGQLSMISGIFNSNTGMHNKSLEDKIRIKAVINWFGVMDIEKFFYHIMTDKDKNKMIESEKISLHETSEKYSPVKHINNNTPPVITIHGSDDSAVPISQAKTLHNKLESAGVRNKLMIIEKGKHAGFSNEQWAEAFDGIFKFIGVE